MQTSFLKTSNNFKTTLAAGITSGALTLTLSSGANAPVGAFRATIWGQAYSNPTLDSTREIIEGSVSGTTMTITSRGLEGTTAKAWSSGDNIIIALTSGQLDNLKTAINSLEDVALKESLGTSLTNSIIGGIFNGGFENAPAFTAATTTQLKWIDGTASGSSTNDKYGWRLRVVTGSASANFESAISNNGKYSLKISTLDVSSRAIVDIHNSSGNPSNSKYLFTIKPSTQYILKGVLKTKLNSGSSVSGASIVFNQYSSSLGSPIVSTNLTGAITSSTETTLYATIITTNASASYIAPSISVVGTDGDATLIMDAWFDDIDIQEIITNTTSVVAPTEIKPILQIKGSNQNLDISQENGGSYGNFGQATTGYGQKVAQTFIPSENNITFVNFKLAKLGSPTDSIMIRITNTSANLPGASVIASVLLPASSITAYSTEYSINLGKVLLTPGTLYAIQLLRTGSNDDTNYYQVQRYTTSDSYISGKYYQDLGSGWTNSGLENTDCFFKVYDEATGQGLNLILNGIKTAIFTDENGVPNNSIFDLDNNLFVWNGDLLTNTTDNYFTQLSPIVSAVDGGYYNTTDFSSLSAYRLDNPNGWITSNSGATERYIVYRFNTILPINSLILNTWIYGNNKTSVQLSTDGFNWTEILPKKSGNTYDNTIISSDLINGLVKGKSIFYVRIYGDTTNATFNGILRKVVASVDYSIIPRGIIYPLATNEFTESFNTSRLATRLRFDVNKYINKNGVPMPSLSLTDSSNNLLSDPIFLQIDNSRETNPSVNILLAGTTSSQQSGTGSANSTTGYILNDGEYMTLSSSVSMGVITYQVGAGTTSFSNITKNTLYVSAIGNYNTYYRPSLQGYLSAVISNSGLKDIVRNIQKELNDIRNSLFNKKTLIRRITASVGSNSVLDNFGVTDIIIGVPSTSSTVSIDIATTLLYKIRTITIKDESGAANTNNITITTQGSELIDGSATKVISTNYGAVTIYSNGVNWFTK